jgi:pimeloyl-ACP methyl ester carboxylesterase
MRFISSEEGMNANSFTTLQGTELAYTDTGAGKPILFLHGLSFDRRMWLPATEYLVRHYRCISVDLPGHGNSGDRSNYDLEEIATELHELVEHLVLQHLAIVGHAIGAVLATVYASRYPVDLVVNIDQPLYVSPFIDLLQGLKSDLASDKFSETVSRLLPSPGIDAVPEHYLQLVVSRPRQPVMLGYWALFLDSTPAEIEALIAAKLHAIAVPYLAIHSAPVADFYRGWLCEHLERLEILVIPEGERFPHLTDPESFAGAVARVAK